MIQLKLRTEYSFGATFAPIPRVIERLKAIGCSAAAIVDFNSTWGHVPWWKACAAAGIRPLLGVDLVVSDNDLTQRMWFLAASASGLRELYGWSSLAHNQHQSVRNYQLPRLYRADVEAMTGEILKFAGDILDGSWLASIGAFLDLSPASRILNHKKTQLAKEHKLKLVATSDNAYAFPEDRGLVELATYGAMKPSAQEILEQLDHQKTAAEIVERCSTLELPKAPMVRAKGNLEKLCRAGIKKRKMNWTPKYEERLQYELELIRSKDFESYFIIVADMVQEAKRHMLVGPSRGSAAGSLVCYLSRITEIDPLPPNLYFERFIDVSRTDLPDIDLDFPDEKRHIVFEYMAKKYGKENVAQIGTISQYRPKSALIKVCKALNIPPSATAAVKVAMIERSSADARASNCLEDTFKETSPGREFAKNYPHALIASQLEGHASHTGVHAAGLLVSNDSITNYATVDENGIAHIDKNSAEFAGLLKIDVLGLRTLGVLEAADVPVDWYSLALDDEQTFEIFNEGRMCGIFQFEGEALRAISKEISFESIAEIDAVTALARPGPFIGGVTEQYVKRKNGEPYKSIHPLVEEHMKETFGLPVYQEQTLAIVREIGKFDWKETSTIRKAMSKRMGKEFFDSYWEKFKAGAMSQGIAEGEARKTWELINAMGSWQMNKAHTFSYAVISYWTAYLKRHFPLEFAAANLKHAKDEDSAIELLREMVREGIEYVPFDIDHSEINWSVKNGKLLGGFLALKGIGEAKALPLIEARNAGKLTPKQRKQIEEAENVFNDIFPISNKYKHLYSEPDKHGIGSKLVTIAELQNIPHRHERVFIGELISKSARNANEDVLVKKRNGVVETKQLDFLDLRLRDDTGTIGGRIGRWDFEAFGRELLEKIPTGAHLLVRAAFYNDIRYAFIKKWRRLDG